MTTEPAAAEPHEPADPAARRAGERLGVVLSGGGVRGLAHVGVLRALDEAGLSPKVVVGVSMGAVVGATYAANPRWWRAIQRLDRTRLPSMVDTDSGQGVGRLRSLVRSARSLAPSVWTLGRQGFDEVGRAALDELFGTTRTFAQCRRELAVVATDLAAGERVVLDDGDLVEATLASATLPGIARPLVRDGLVLVDGGFADPLPVDVARTMGAERVLAVHTGQQPDDGRVEGWTTALLRGMEISLRSFTAARSGDADMLLRPTFAGRVSAIDFSAFDEVVEAGRRAAAAQVPAIREALGVR